MVTPACRRAGSVFVVTAMSSTSSFLFSMNFHPEKLFRDIHLHDIHLHDRADEPEHVVRA
jgi:hypothetical protein